MDDELEDKVFYQTFTHAHMKILSKFAVGVPSLNTPLAYIWKLCRLYILRPEVIFFGVILFILLCYLQAVDVWSRSLLARLQATLGRQKSKGLRMSDNFGSGELQCWEEIRTQSAAFAVLGRRPRMEDRFIVEENINNNTGISFFAIFDGHGGEFAADYAKDILVKNIYNKVNETVKLLKQKNSNDENDILSSYENFAKKTEQNKNYESNAELKRRKSLIKTQSTTDQCKNADPTKTDVFTMRLNNLMRQNGNAKENFLTKNNNNNLENSNTSGPPPNLEAKCYIENGKINFGKLITDEVLSADYKLVEQAKKTTNIAGTTALISILYDSQLVVANVGDSRGVMCNERGIAIPLSFDHKPQQVRERKRIHDAGGFIAFRGVWRVAGILATSRALGDYPLKDKNLVIANPDILTFDLNDHKPLFLILASDGLWDTFSNDEACSFIKQHLNEADFGAKALAMMSYQRGSVDNITVLVIVFKNGNYKIAVSSNSHQNSATTPITNKL